MSELEPTDDLESLRFVPRADVYKAGRRAARLERRTDSIVFSYDDEYRRDGGAPVASTLPLDRAEVRTHSAGALPPFFAGLLPEGRRLSNLRRAVKSSADDELSLLLVVGADTIGDVQVVPEGMEPVATPVIADQDWSELRFAQLYRRLTGQPDRVALPGVQDKASAAMITLPLASAAGHYILKLNPPEFPHLVENEAFFLDVARRCGLAVAEAHLVHDAEGVPGLAVRRFDRVIDPDRTVLALAQEDACQVLDRYPADKYNLTSEQVGAGLIARTQARPVAARDFLIQITFAYLTANGDAHAKNFSVLQAPDGEWRIAPAYDLPSSQPYGDHTMALSVDGRRRDLGRAHLLSLARSLGLRPAAAERVIDHLVDSVDAWIDDVQSLPFGDRRVHKLRREIIHRRDRLARPRSATG